MGGRQPRRFDELLARLPGAAVSGTAPLYVTGLSIDSREVTRGDCFVALRGAHVDGHRFAGDAAAHGATVLVVEEPIEADAPTNAAVASAAVVRVADTKRALSILAAAYYGDPSERVTIAGVTGTNGKTTTTRMIAAIANGAGIPCGVIGTVGADFGTTHWDLANTTPLPHELQRLLAQMEAASAKAVAMEVSSHALALERVEDVRFAVAALTNVTRDHLDFHGDLESYRNAKRRLFSLAPRSVLNVDDPSGARWAEELRAEGRDVLTYGTSAGAMVTPRDLEVDGDGSRFTVDGRGFELKLPGRFNVWNALAAIGAARALGIADDASALGLGSLQRVPGRMERVRGAGFDVVVDYAHTPDALENALRALRETTRGKLAVVFGCGGDRDRGKRAEMGAVAAKLADRVYLADDNPRSEDPHAILNDILAGTGNDAQRIHAIGDRATAIRMAIEAAAPGDIVLVAGKGHENYQIVGDRVLPFDDVAVARGLLAPDTATA